MKTKHLLTAMVLPALFAACTNDDLEVVSNDAVTAEGRKVAENVTLNFSEPTDSRLAYGSAGYTWQANDEIGACLMDVLAKDDSGKDVYHRVGTHWSQWFNMVDHIHTNYKFTRNSAGNWTTEAKMCEGNYFFYYPYDANAGLRNAYTISRSTQALSGTSQSALLKAFTDNNAFVGYGKVYAGDNASESVNVSMVPVFGATGITIKNTGTNTYTIEKIVLRGTAVGSKATIDPKTCTPNKQYHTLLTDKTNWVEGNGNLNDVRTESQTWFNAAQYAADDVYDPAYVSNNSGWYNKLNALKDVLDYNVNETEGNAIEVTIASGNVVKPQASINVIAMLMPTPDGEENEFDVLDAVTEVTNDNTIILDIHTDKGLIRDIKLNYHYTATNGSMSDDAKITNVLTDRAITRVGDGKSVQVTFDDTSLDTPKEMTVNGGDELANLIHWNKNSESAIKANLTTNVVITKAMYNELAASKIGVAEINGGSAYNVTIAADVPAGALDRFTFTNVATVYVKGTQTLAKAKTSPVEVLSGATLNVTGNKRYALVTNNGTLNINSKLSNIAEIVNQHNGVMNVAAGNEITTEVKVVNGCGEWWDNTVLNNAGTVRKLENKAYATVNNTGVIGTEAQVNSIENVTNSGTINNNSGKTFVVTNNGNVWANGTSTTRINGNNGNIIITNLDENDGNFLAGEMGSIVQEIKEPTNTDGVDVRANVLWLSSTLKVEKKDANGNYVDVNLNATAKNGQVQVVATGADARIDGNGQKLTISHITVNAATKLVLNKVDVFNYVTDGSSNAKVTMNGDSNNGVATITINNNASLTSNTQVVASQENRWNVIDNNSNSTVIGLAGYEVGNE